MAQPVEPTLTISGRSLAEGAHVLPFGVYLSQPSATVVTFEYATVDDTATAGSDYFPVSGIYKIDPGVTIGPLPVDIIDDTLDEPDERFEMVISKVNGAVFDAAGSDTYGVILDDDAPPPTPIPTPLVDQAPPSVTPPGADFVRGARLGLGARTVPLFVAFDASDPSGISATRLQHRLGRRAFAEVRLPSPDAGRAIVRLSQSRRLVHRFRSRATDGAGNTSAWAAAPAFRVAVRQDGSRAVRQMGRWGTKRSASHFGGTVRSSTKRGARQRLAAVGTDFAIVSTKGPNRGRAVVLLDGRRVATIDLYGRTTTPRSIIYAVSFPSAGRHTIDLWATGTKSRQSKGKRVDLDAFLVLSRP